MSLFDWLKDESAPQSGEAAPPTEGNIAAVDAKAAALEAAPTSRKSRRKQAETPNDSSGTGTPSAALRAEISKQLEASFNPKAWASLLSLPADVMITLTGHKHWEVSKDERETMGECGAVAARYLMLENPRTLALLMLSSALFSVYVPRVTEEMKVRRAKNVTPKEEKNG